MEEIINGKEEAKRGKKGPEELELIVILILAQHGPRLKLSGLIGQFRG